MLSIGSIEGKVESGDGWDVIFPGRIVFPPLVGLDFLRISRFSASMARIHCFLTYTDSALNSKVLLGVYSKKQDSSYTSSVLISLTFHTFSSWNCSSPGLR